MIGNSFRRERIKFASFRVTLNLLVKGPSVERVKPSAQLREIILGKLGNSPLYVIEFGHAKIVS